MADLIDRQAAIDIVDNIDTWCGGWRDYAIGKMRELPSAQAERKKGEWTGDNACPFCGFQPWYERDIHTLSFCPNCGADMRGEQDG